MEGKDSHKDILRLRQLEQTKHENVSSSSTATTGTNAYDDRIGNENNLNGFSPALAIPNN